MSEDFALVRAHLSGYVTGGMDARNEALAALARSEQRLREAEAERDRFAARLRDAPLGGGGSHWEGCWRSHIDCCVARAEKAEARVAELESSEYFQQFAKKILAVEVERDALREALEELRRHDADSTDSQQKLPSWAIRVVDAALGGGT